MLLKVNWKDEIICLGKTYQNLWWSTYLENLIFIKLFELIANEQLKFKVII